MTPPASQGPQRPAVVITRPAPDHRSIVEAVVERGLDAIHAPAYRLAPVHASRLDALVARLADFDLAVVTSPFAARIVAAHADRRVAMPPCVTPGAGTADVLRSAGLAATHPERGGTSEDVLRLPELASPSGWRIAIVSAPGGRRLLHRALASRGAEVESVHVYRRELLPPPAVLLARLHDEAPLVVMISSPGTLREFATKLPAALLSRWLRSRFLVSSTRLADSLREQGAESVEVADGASDDSMLRALDRMMEEG